MAFDSLPESMIDTFRLTVVGETWEGWEKPRHLIEQSLYRDRITFVNHYVSDTEVVQFFSTANAVVLPYHRSSTSGPLHIAMSYGLPVIVTSVGGLVEAVENYEGAIVVEPGDTAALQDALLQVATLCSKHFNNPRSWEYTNASYQTLFDAIRTPHTCMGSTSEGASLFTQVSSKKSVR
ncbi:MAG: hypothetical protein PVSMB2_03020 [Ktedonobacteraceae bacterium]